MQFGVLVQVLFWGAVGAEWLGLQGHLGTASGSFGLPDLGLRGCNPRLVLPHLVSMLASLLFTCFCDLQRHGVVYVPWVCRGSPFP